MTWVGTTTKNQRWGVEVEGQDPYGDAENSRQNKRTQQYDPAAVEVGRRGPEHCFRGQGRESGRTDGAVTSC